MVGISVAVVVAVLGAVRVGMACGARIATSEGVCGGMKPFCCFMYSPSTILAMDIYRWDNGLKTEENARNVLISSTLGRMFERDEGFKRSEVVSVVDMENDDRDA